jgi:glutaredoxin-like protein NrdH
VPKIIVYTKPACPQRGATFRALDNAGIEYATIDITDDEQARDYVMSLGYLAVPVVHVSPTVHWSGFRPDRLARLCDSVA